MDALWNAAKAPKTTQENRCIDWRDEDLVLQRATLVPKTRLDHQIAENMAHAFLPFLPTLPIQMLT